MRARRRFRGKSSSLLAMGTDLAMLGFEAQMVIGQRMAMFILGDPKARNEADLMVTKKVKAACEAAMTLALGGTPHTVVQDYRRKVRANRKRLAKG